MKDIPADNEVIAGSIDSIVDRMKAEPGDQELAELRAQIRKRVPLMMRSYFAAYLLRSHLPPSRAPRAAQPGRSDGPQGRTDAQPEGRPSRAEARPPRAEGRSSRGESRPPRSEERPQKAERRQGAQQFTQLFVSIGRNRRVFARELSDLFTTAVQLGKDEIGNVRVFDKYSFVDVVSSKAPEAIAKLSGSQFKGRQIMVNYAKKKEEKEAR